MSTNIQILCAFYQLCHDNIVELVKTFANLRFGDELGQLDASLRP